MKLIVAVDEEWGIGKNNGLLFKLKKDMAFFREQTTGKVVVMGANTFKSFPSGALPNRVNVVLDDSGESHQNTVTVQSVAELDKVLENYDSNDVFVIGGASVYKLLLDRVSTALVTKVHARGDADVFFPCLDELPNWKQTEKSEDVEDNGFVINFCKYERN